MFASRAAKAFSAGVRIASERVSRPVVFGVGVGVAVTAAVGVDSVVRTDTASQVSEILATTKKIAADLGIPDDAAAGEQFSADENYPRWTPAHKSLARKYLTKAVYRELHSKKTPCGFTLDQSIQTAIDMPGAGNTHIGIAAGEAEAYEVFAPLFDPIIEEYHSYSKDRNHVTDLDYTKLRVPVFDPKYVLSTRIRAGRSVKGLPLPPAASRAARRETERLIAGGLQSLSGPLAGKYLPLNDMTPAENQKWIDDHFLFENPDAWTISGGFGRDWPDGRGLFVNDSKTFLVWVNEEDHMRIISMQKGADVVEVFRRFADACNTVETFLKASGAGFAHTEHLGYITTCPTNLGTGMRASVHAQLPLLGKVDGFKEYASAMGLQIRGKGGEKDHSYTGVFDVSNRFRLGYSEVQLVQMMLDGLEKLIELEQKLERGETVTLK